MNNMILVFCVFGGQKLLGKARELADVSGSRVIALVRRDEPNTQSLISLGADEVLTSSADGISEWVEVIADLVNKSSGLQRVMFPSNRLCDAIMGGVYFECKEKIGAYLDGADRVEESASRSFLEFGIRASTTTDGRISLVSIRLASLPVPFEDGSRFGKVTPIPDRPEVRNDFRLSSIGDCRGVSSILTILLGRTALTLQEKCEKLGQKYMASVKVLSGRTQVVYGPCLAIEVEAKLGDLPAFKGPLISVNSERAPISAISDLAGVTDEIDAVLAKLL